MNKLTGVDELQLVFSSIEDPEIEERVKQVYEATFDKFCHEIAEALETLIAEWKYGDKSKNV